MVDKERVPIVYDGKDGNIIQASCSVGSITVECNAKGLVKKAVSQIATFSLVVNGTIVSSPTVTVKSEPAGVRISTVRIPAGAVDISIASGTNRTDLSTGIIFTVSSVNYSAEVVVPIICSNDGSIGETGHTGRFYYYAGPYDASKTYSIEATQAPYIQYTNPSNQAQTGFFMLDNGGADPGTIPYEVSGVAPSFTSDADNPWTQMASEHQYYIARAFFGENAYLGSFIINGDWMISQYGTLLYQDGTKTTVNADNVSSLFNGKIPYAWFDTSDPTASFAPTSGYKFAPSFAVDGLTGRTFQNNAVVRGTVYATDGEFSGTIHAKKGTIGDAEIVKDGARSFLRLSALSFVDKTSDGSTIGDLYYMSNQQAYVQVNYHAAKDCVASSPDGPSLFLLRRNAAS